MLCDTDVVIGTNAPVASHYLFHSRLLQDLLQRRSVIIYII